ncbi:MAG: type II secretion system F family protein [Planctomycetota bacterium]|nr:type II secretion system F family protein [Planctomycetota bacterium]
MFADASMFRSLASLHRAGVPWPQALASAAGGDPGWRGAEQALAGGAPLSEALAANVEPLERALLRAGEASGTLERALENIAQRKEDEVRMRGARRTALLYPVIMAHVAALLAGVPDLLQGRVGAAALWALGILLPLYAILWATRPRRVSADAPQHPGTRPPRAGLVLRNAIEEADARALGAFADCYEAGMRLDEALELSGRAGAGGRVAFDLYRARPRVADGAALHTAWHALPEEHARELRAAEESGELGQTMRHLAARLSFQVEMRRKRFSSVLPLVVLLVVGAIVGYRVISFYADVYSGLGQY